jgi:hypothetical protein
LAAFGPEVDLASGLKVVATEEAVISVTAASLNFNFEFAA